MSFPLVGNESVQLTVNNALHSHRLPHAILIDGDIGTGRHTLGRFLAKAVLCSGNSIPCDCCKDCRLFNSLNHPDLKLIAPEEGKKNISVAQIRELKSEAYIKPNISLSKVFIIDLADTLNEQAQNALLKILEEPPHNTVFILIAESKASFLDTIISRCAVLSLNTPTYEAAFDYIMSLGEKDGGEIASALKSSRNNIGKSLTLLKGKGDTKPAQCAKEFLESILKGKQYDALCALNQLEKSRVDVGRLFKDLKYLVAEEIKDNPQTVRAADFLKFYNALNELEQLLVTNINLSLLFAQLTAQAKEILS